MAVEQHLMGLLQIGPQDEGAAVGELDVGDLQLGPFAADDRPVLRPVELESLARLKRQGHVGAAAAGLLLPQPGGLPLARERRHPVVGSLIPERGQISVHLPDRSLLLAGSARLQREHVRQLVGIRIELARALGRVELGLHTVGAQVLADRVPRQTCAP